MSAPLIDPPEPARWTEVVFEVLMAALCIFTPLAFGSVDAWSEEIFLGIIACLFICFAVQRILNPCDAFTGTWAYAAIILFLAFCTVQLIPLPAHLLRAISAGTFQTKTALLADLPASMSFFKRMTITFYPAASREQLRLVVGVSAVFVIVVNYYRTIPRITRLLMTIACVGLAVACLAFYQNITSADTIYGTVTAIQKNSGPFICHSHFAQFMNLSLGAAFGLLLVRWSEISKHRQHFGGMFAEFCEPRSWTIWLLLAICILLPIAMFLSLARMGTISLLVAGGISCSILAWRTKIAGRGSLMVALGIVILAVLLASGFDAVYSRLATIGHVELVDEGRFQMLKDMTAEFKLFPLVGTGLGTHEFVFPMFDHSHIANLATHAENEYAELLEETGAIGAAIAAWFLIVIIISYWKAMRLVEPIQYAAFGLGLGLLAILIHSASDFGQHVPADALLTAVSCGLLVNLATMARKKSGSTKAVPARRLSLHWRQFSLASGSIAGLGIFAVVLWSADKNRQAESLWSQSFSVQTALERNAWQGTNAEYTELLAPVTQAVKLVPDDVTYGYWLNVFRWHAISRVTDPKTKAVLFTPQSIEFAARITDQFEALRRLCPTFGPPLCVAGQIEDFVLHRPQGAKDIEQAFKLTPYDPTVCFIAGKLAVSQRNWDESLRAFERCASLGGSDSEIIDTCIGAGRPDLALEVVTGRRASLEYLTDRLSGMAAYHDLFLKCRSEAATLLLAEANQPGASAEVMADLATRYASDGKNAKAVVWYQKALDLNYGQVDWRLSLAQALSDLGRVSDAMEQAKICIRLRPQSQEAQTMIGELSTRMNSDSGTVGDASAATVPADRALAASPTR